MAFSRAAAARSFCFRAARPSVVRPQLFRQIARRTYASGGHESAKAGGDAVWAAGAVAVTVPSCWYLLSNGPDTSHGHGDHGDSHGKEHEEEHEEESEDEEPKDEEAKDEGSEEKPEQSEDKSEDGDDKSDDGDSSEKSEDSDSDEEDKGADTPDTSDDEGDSDKSSDDKYTRKSVPDAKGGSKARKESNQAIKAGEVDSQAATSGKHSGKQEGLSNTDTKHSTDIDNNRGGQSKKGEGVPETAKSKGPVDAKRPQV